MLVKRVIEFRACGSVSEEPDQIAKDITRQIFRKLGMKPQES